MEKFLTSSTWQKYGAANNSGRQTTSTPRAAASAMNAAALSRFSPAARLTFICTRPTRNEDCSGTPISCTSLSEGSEFVSIITQILLSFNPLPPCISLGFPLCSVNNVVHEPLSIGHVQRSFDYPISLFADMPGADVCPRQRTQARGVYSVLLAGTLVWCGAIIAAPLLYNGPWTGVSSFLYQFFHPICNQLDSHSFHIAGEKTAVCTRCTSIYFSFLAGLLVYPVFRSLTSRVGAGRGWFVVAVTPMVVDVVLSLLNVHQSSALTRVLTGSFFGIIAVFIVVPTIIDAMAELMTRPRIQPSPTIKKD